MAGIYEGQVFQFLNVTGSIELDDLARMTVRAQSLRDYHEKRKRQEIREQANDGCRPTSQRGRVSKGRVQRFRLGLQGLQPTQTQPQPAYVLGCSSQPVHTKGALEKALEGTAHDAALAEKICKRNWGKVQQKQKAGKDIFAPALNRIGQFHLSNMLPLPCTPRIRLLLQQLFKRVTSNSPTRDYREAWFEIAVQDEAFFYVALCQSAADMNLTLQKGDSLEAIYYQNKAIGLLNRRLGDPTSRVSDATIGTIAALACYEVSNGSLEVADAHVDALQQLIQLRGGLTDSSISTKLRRLVLWADLTVASLRARAPQFPGDVDISFQTSSIASSDHPIEKTSAMEAHALTSNEHSTDIIPVLLSELRHLAAVQGSNKFFTAKERNLISSGDKLYIIQRQLIGIAGVTSSKSPGTVESCCAIAALIYISTCLCQTSFESRVVENHVDRLRRCVEVIAEEIGFAVLTTNEKLSRRAMWAVIIGGIVSNGESHKYFVETLATICNLSCLYPHSGLNGLLEDVLWNASLDAWSQPLWQELARLSRSTLISGER